MRSPNIPGPQPGAPAVHLPVDMRDIRAAREETLGLREDWAARCKVDDIRNARLEAKLDTLDRIARATFSELTRRDAGTIHGVDHPIGRTARMFAAAVTLVLICFLAACAGARVGIQ